MRFERLESIARREVRLTLFHLPSHLRQAAQPCRIEVSDHHPTDELMGLFEGCPLGQTLSEDPADWPRITLFLGAIWDEVMGDARAYREEVRVTLLHELGHYLGLDEDQVAALGLA